MLLRLSWCRWSRGLVDGRWGGVGVANTSRPPASSCLRAHARKRFLPPHIFTFISLNLSARRATSPSPLLLLRKNRTCTRHGPAGGCSRVGQSGRRRGCSFSWVDATSTRPVTCTSVEQGRLLVRHDNPRPPRRFSGSRSLIARRLELVRVSRHQHPNLRGTILWLVAVEQMGCHMGTGEHLCAEASRLNLSSHCSWGRRGTVIEPEDRVLSQFTP